MSSKSNDSHTSPSISIGLFSIIAAVVGGVATSCVFAMVIYISVQRRLRQRQEQHAMSPPDQDVEKSQSTITLPPPIYYTQLQEKVPAISPPPRALPPPPRNLSNQVLQRPTITVVTDIPPVTQTPKWKLKRVPVPRFSKLPPTPDAITRSRSWLRSPRQFRKSLRSVKGLPATVRPPVPGTPSLASSSLAVPVHSYLLSPSPPSVA